MSDPVPSLSSPDLLAAARAALQWAVAPSSNFRVGAALLTPQQTIYTGCNIESPVYLGICAERVALFKALSEGARAFIALAVVAEAAVSCLPCGTCRQLLWEFAPNLEILVAAHHPSRAENVVRYSLKDLLPFPFERTGHGPFRS
ncbi:MAG: cytidine deaminase [Nitrospirae bacterium]|nr:MAG: cytidine deaminase [Nitrospirota bacterium]